LRDAWQHLEKDQRALLALHAEGYTLEELHEITDLTTDVLKARLYRARVRLGKLLAMEGATVAAAMER
jgi:DNA-directed RNA polymerase specialized sigma24 family protein